MHSSTIVLESQLDWLTASVNSHEKAVQLNWDVTRWGQAEARDGEAKHAFSIGPYVGWRIGRVRFGLRANAAIVQLSGDLARQHFDSMWKIHDSLTRLDIATTVRLESYDAEVARWSYSAAIEHRKAHPTSALPSLVQDSDGGSTLYVGGRASDRYLRIYNKEREQRAVRDLEGAGRYVRCWRYELELKGPAAHAVGQALAAQPDRAGWIQSYIHHHCIEHGIQPMFDPSTVRAIATGFRRRSDRDSRLAWLQKSVAPTITWLLESTPRDELLHKLGLDS